MQRVTSASLSCLAQANDGLLLKFDSGILVTTRIGHLPVKPGMGEQTFGNLVGLPHMTLMSATGRWRIAKHQFAIRETT
jgi:hypothetical protein